MAKTKTAAPKKSKGTSAKEIKAWLRGIQEFQPEGWTPSKEQWDAIRERIFNLDEVAPAAPQDEVRYVREQPRYDRGYDDGYEPPRAFAHAAPALVAAPGQNVINSQPAPADTSVAMKVTGDGVVSVIADPTKEGEYQSPF